jgi:hypothetical protein
LNQYQRLEQQEEESVISYLNLFNFIPVFVSSVLVKVLLSISSIKNENSLDCVNSSIPNILKLAFFLTVLTITLCDRWGVEETVLSVIGRVANLRLL